jgi:hypothetical protein
MIEREEAVRPKAIVWFEGLIFLSLALGIAQVVIERRAHVRLTLESLLFVFAIPVLLTLLVSRRRSKLALGIGLFLFAAGLPIELWIVARGLFAGSVPLAAAQTIIQLVAYALPFMPDAWDWLNHRTPTARLRDTFS